MTATFLKDYREKRKLSQEELAEELKIPVFTLRAYEQGKRRPSVEKAKELANKMGCKWTDFFNQKVRVSYYNMVANIQNVLLCKSIR